MPDVRVHNLTGADFDSVRLYVPGPPREAVDLGVLANGQFSEYRSVPLAYRFAEIEASGPAGSYSLRPYDYVGEEALPEGRYTYRLRIDQGRLTLELEASDTTDG
jgi:hypothetical protein